MRAINHLITINCGSHHIFYRVTHNYLLSGEDNITMGHPVLVWFFVIREIMSILYFATDKTVPRMVLFVIHKQRSEVRSVSGVHSVPSVPSVSTVPSVSSVHSVPSVHSVS